MELNEIRSRVHYLLACARGVHGLLEPEKLMDVAEKLHNYHPWLYGHAEEEARTCLRESINIARSLDQKGLCRARPFLLTALQNMGEALKYPPKGTEGITQTEELVSVWRELAAKGGPFISQSNLANSLNSLAIRLHEAGRLEDSLRTGAECLEAWRQAKDDLPAEIRFMHLVAIQNQFNRQVELGHQKGLETLAHEAVQLSTRLLSGSFVDQNLREHTRHLGNEFRKMVGMEEVPALIDDVMRTSIPPQKTEK